MAIRNGWTTDEKNTAGKQDRYIHGGDLSKQHAAYDAECERKAQLSKKQMKAGKISPAGKFQGTW